MSPYSESGYSLCVNAASIVSQCQVSSFYSLIRGACQGTCVLSHKSLATCGASVLTSVVAVHFRLQIREGRGGLGGGLPA